MIRELRIYDCAPGRMGDLKRRFEDHTLRIFARHGISCGGFFTVRDNPEQLVYFLDWQDMAEREAKFPAMRVDPEWIRVRADSERDGPLTISISSRFLEPLELTPRGPGTSV